MDYTISGAAEWFGEEWLSCIVQTPTLQHLDLGDILVSPPKIKTLCEALPDLTALYFNIHRHATVPEITDALISKKSSMRELGLRRPPLCTRSEDNDYTACFFNDWPALQKMTIDASFLFGTVPCSSDTGGAGLASQRLFHGLQPNRVYLPSWINIPLHERLPPRLHKLHIEFMFPQAVFQSDPQQHSIEHEYAWILDLASRHPCLRVLELEEQTHHCATRGEGMHPRVGNGRSYLYEYAVSEEGKRAFRERGIVVRIMLMETDTDELRERFGIEFPGP